MAKFYPSLDEIPYLHEPVTAGEGELLNWLDAHLDDSYDVYFQPRVNGNHMDVVILRKNHGAMIIEVKDWNPDSYWIDSSNQWHVRTERGWHAITEDPIEQVTRYRKALYLLYMNGFQEAFAGDNNMYGMISRCVFFSRAPRAWAEEIRREHYADEPNLQIVGREFMEDSAYFAHALDYAYLSKPWSSKIFTDTWYDELCRLLQPSMHTRENVKHNRDPLNQQQERLAISRQGRRQKICGPAGTGKTRTLAHLAVHAWRRLNEATRSRKEVLVLTYNITLRSYIHDAIRDVPETFMMCDIIIKHYHLFISDYAPKLADGERRPDGFLDTFRVENPAPDMMYDVILVDEVQDYQRLWIENLYTVLKPGGEIVFFGDEHQNIYGRKMEKSADQPPRPYTGIPGAWNILKTSFRTANSIAQLANAFRTAFLPQYSAEDIEMELQLAGACRIRYHYGTPNPETMHDIDQRFLQEAFHKERKGNGQNDVAFLSTERSGLRDIDETYRRHGHETTTVFEMKETFDRLYNNLFLQGLRGRKLKETLDERLYDMRRSKKFNFRMENGKTKICTIHSFKGWELDTVVLLVTPPSGEERGSDEEAESWEELLYTGITRARHNLLIFNTDDRFDRFIREYAKDCADVIELQDAYADDEIPF